MLFWKTALGIKLCNAFDINRMSKKLKIMQE
jgi:hypothetical protein